MSTVSRLALGVLVTAVAAAVVFVSAQLPAIGAGALLHPARRQPLQPPPPGCQLARVTSQDIELAGWRCETPRPRRGTMVFLHGIGANRDGATGLVAWFLDRGVDVAAFDSRAHGQSGGDACTYGFHETGDLRRIIDSLPAGPVVLLGSSLGAAVALQYAPGDSRVVAVAAVEAFSDLRTVATERAPFVFTREAIRRAFILAEGEGRFVVDAVSPVASARHVTVPVLLVHGAADLDTPPDHSQRVFAALGGPKHLDLVPGAAHNESLRGSKWDEVLAWIDGQLPATRLGQAVSLRTNER